MWNQITGITKKVKMCKECGSCSTEHGARTVDDAIDAVIDLPII
jgi:hypothetical protein